MRLTINPFGTSPVAGLSREVNVYLQAIEEIDTIQEGDRLLSALAKFQDRNLR